MWKEILHQTKRGGQKILSNMESSKNPIMNVLAGHHTMRGRMAGGGRIMKNAAKEARNARSGISKLEDEVTSFKNAAQHAGPDFQGAYESQIHNRTQQIGDMKSSVDKYHRAGASGLRDIAGGVGSFFTGGDYAGQGMKRAGVVAARHGAIGAGMVGLRYASGGTMTQNNKGQRDIAGVPFF